MSGAGEAAVEQTDVGSYFVANYPPFSAWKPEYVTYADAALSESENGDAHRRSSCSENAEGRLAMN